MKKNVVWWPAVKNNDPDALEKFGGYDYFEYSRKTWKYWCEKNDVLFVEFTEPVESDLHKYRVNWQKAIFVFDELERRNIQYDQIALIDSTAMIKWDAPNFFKLTNNKFTAFPDRDNMNWVYQSIQGYKDIFDYKDFDQGKYFNSGFMIFNKDHKSLFNSLKEFYIENIDEFINLQDKKVRKGNDQTPVNYWIQMNNIDVNLDLSLGFNLTHLHRKEMFHFNWQLKLDKIPHFLKYGYVWRFNGIPKDQRTDTMKQVWDIIQHHYTDKPIKTILDKVNHKDTYKNATSRTFKKDLYDYLKDKQIKNIIEFGCCQGDTTKVLSLIAEKVYASDISEENIEIAKNKCMGDLNIEFEIKDVNTEWNYPNPDLVYLDALHDYKGILQGLNKIKTQYPHTTIIMDDYGHIMNTVKPIIDNMIKENKIEVLKWLGEDKGYVATNDKVFIDKEGLIFKFKN
jgi:hypothetical protein|tara:strand:+ start:340 stop:1701 length:1362 start_codon:yes stop_codon:yes gene_type:complete